MITFKNFNIADWFSFYRICAAPFLLILIILDLRLAFTWLLLVSFSTDAIDGYLARKYKMISAKGAQLDSLGDQLTTIVALIGLYVFEKDFIHENLIIIIIAFLPYFLQMGLAYWKYGKTTAYHTYLAKFSALLQGIFFLWALFFSPSYTLFYIMIGFSILETLEEITLIFMYDKWVSDVRGIYWALHDKRRVKKNEK